MQKHEQEPVVSEQVMFCVGLLGLGQLLFYGGTPAVEPVVVELLGLSVSEAVLATVEWGVIIVSGGSFVGGVVGLMREGVRGELEFDWRVEE